MTRNEMLKPSRTWQDSSAIARLLPLRDALVRLKEIALSCRTPAGCGLPSMEAAQRPTPAQVAKGASVPVCRFDYACAAPGVTHANRGKTRGRASLCAPAAVAATPGNSPAGRPGRRSAPPPPPPADRVAP